MAEAQESQHFLDYWRVIHSRKEVVVAVALFVILTAVAITLSLPKVYMSSTRITVKRDLPAMGVQQEQNPMAMAYDPYFLRTQFEIIQSRPILYEVIRNLRLTENFGKIYSETGVALTAQEAYKILVKSMKVQQYRDTSLIEIRVYRSTHRSTIDEARKDATRIANAIAEVYRNQRMLINSDEKRLSLEALAQAFQRQQKLVEDLEKKLEEIRSTHQVVSVGGSGDKVLTLSKERIERLEMNRIDARNRMLEHKKRLEEISKLSGTEQISAAAYLMKDQTLSGLQESITQAEVKLRLLAESYGPKHPEVLSVQKAVEDLKKKIDSAMKGLLTALQTDYEIARNASEEIEKDLKDARIESISNSQDKVLPFARVENELQRHRSIRDVLETKLTAERIEFELPRTPVEVIDPAEEPPANDPVGPNVILNLILGVLAGIMSGIGLAFFIEYVDTSVKTVEDIERLLETTVLGVIPQKVMPLVEEGPESRHAESYRVLQTNIQFSKKMTNARIVCVTSGGAGEGKSLTVCNLACVYAFAGQKVLVVDSDLRRPTQHKMLKNSNSIGLADVLMGKKTVDEVIQPTAVAGLDFLPSGRMPSSAHGMLSVEKIHALLEAVHLRYDMIFLDAPPILGVSDASILVSEADGVLLVIQHRSYPRAVSSRAKAMVEQAGGNLAGVVLNNINVSRDYYYYYHSSYYYDQGHKQRSSRDSADAKGKKT